MEIEKILERNEITITSFANKLKISRPTLYKFIERYNLNQNTGNEKYDIIFNKLFQKEISKEEFENELEKYSYLVDRDKKHGVLELDTKRTDTYSLIVSNIKKDLNEEEFDATIYWTLNLFLQRYREDELFLLILRYFYILNNSEAKYRSEKEEKFCIKLNKLLKETYEDKLKYNEKEKEYFENRRKEIKRQIEEKRKEAKKITERVIEEEIQKQILKGISPEDISIEEILRKIKKSL